MLKIYGSMLCPDCVQCRQDLDEAGIAYEYLDFADNLKNLKEFLVIREGNALFGEVRSARAIGIPCIVTGDGTVTFTWKEYM